MAGLTRAQDKKQIFNLPRHRHVLGKDRSTWIQYAVFLATVVLVLAPILPTIYQSLLSQALYAAEYSIVVDNYVELFTRAAFGSVILNSIWFAILTTIFAQIIAVVTSIIIVRVRTPGGRVAGALLLWPIYISPLVLAFSWIIMYGPAGYVTGFVESIIGVEPWHLYTIPGMALTEAVAVAPIAYLYCSGALRLADTSLEEAARTCGAGPFRIIWSVLLPLLRPPMFYSSLLILSIALETLSIPLLYGGPKGIEMFASFIYLQALNQPNPDYGLIAAAAVFILAIVAILVCIQAYALRNAKRFVSVKGKAVRTRPLEFGVLRWVGSAFLFAYLIIGPLLPIAGLVLRSFTQVLTPLISPLKVLTLSNWTLIFSYSHYVDAIINNVIIAVIGSVITTLFATLAVLVAKRSKFKLSSSVEFAALVPQVIPGIILGIGFLWAFSIINPVVPINGTLIALIIAFGVRSLPQAFGAIAPIVLQIGEELDAAARTIGADWWYTFSRVLFRLVMPAMFAAFVLIFAQMIKEFTPAVFLSTADTQVIGTISLKLWINGNAGAVAALSTLQIAIAGVFVFFASKVFKVGSNA